jgi:hypothetical protein
MAHFDRITVVTVPEDSKVKTVCSKYNTRCVATHAFYAEGSNFNKARGINYGLQNMNLDHWVCHIDCDIILSNCFMFKKFLAMAELDKKCLYGMDRVNIVGHKQWEEFKASEFLQYRWGWLINSPPFPLGARISHGDYGYLPIGYFQLWHPQGSGITRYPTRQGSAEHTDVLHAMQWDRKDRILLPEMFAVHLESPSSVKMPGGMGTNWHGRKSKTFSLDEEDYKLCPKPNQVDNDTKESDHAQYFT